jgi:hypothetical protein
MRPTGIVLGTQKGGTTALYHYLSQHPDVVPSLQKEIHFFNCDAHYEQSMLSNFQRIEDAGAQRHDTANAKRHLAAKHCARANTTAITKVAIMFDYCRRIDDAVAAKLCACVDHRPCHNHRPIANNHINSNYCCRMNQTLPNHLIARRLDPSSQLKTTSIVAYCQNQPATSQLMQYARQIITTPQHLYAQPGCAGQLKVVDNPRQP